jgi:excisionase family DNA binding protein
MTRGDVELRMRLAWVRDRLGVIERELGALVKERTSLADEATQLADQIACKRQEGEITLGSKLYLTTIEAAHRTGMTGSNIRKLVKQGRIWGQRHGTDWIVDEQSLAGFVANRKNRTKRGRPSKRRSEPDGS